jgi:uncharacterized membrane protein YhhN
VVRLSVDLMPPVAVWSITILVMGALAGSSALGSTNCLTESVIVAMLMALRVSQPMPCYNIR